jgi:peptidoglycan/xylan/chitin deacetylase (PgdA/CDA1 family)
MAAGDALAAAGLGERLTAPRPGARILVYHGVCPAGTPRINARFLPLPDFERQVAALARDFHVVPLADVFEGKLHPARFTVAVTFDDGYANNLELALPVLERHGVPATFFVTAAPSAGHVALCADLADLAAHATRDDVEVRGERFRWTRRRGHASRADGTSLKERCKDAPGGFVADATAALLGALGGAPPAPLEMLWRLLDEDGVRRLAASPLAAIGSHGVRHLALHACGAEEALRELRESKAWLERAAGREVAALAFPYGAHDDGVLRMARDTGYRHLVADGPLSASAPDLQGRLTVNPFISWVNQVRAIHEGDYV